MTDQRERVQAQLLDAAELALPQLTDAGALAALLYDRWYAPADGATPHDLDPVEVTAHLRAADAAGARFELGWSVITAKDALARIGPPQSPWQVPASRREEVRWVHPVDLVVPDGVGLRPRVGTPIAVSTRRDSVTLLVGWWTTMSEAWSRASPPLVRLYWSVDPRGLYRLVEGLTACLGAAHSYCLKCPLDMERCRRPDAVVLYLSTVEWPAIAPSIYAGYRQVRRWLRPRVPALTLELAPGLALAEEPEQPEDESFGMSRCRIVATGLWRARQTGIREVGALRAHALAALAEHGIRAEMPWLNPGSAAAYPFEH